MTEIWRAKGEQQTFSSSHTFLLICSLMPLTGSNSQVCTCSPWILLQLPCLLGQRHVLSSKMKGPGFCKIPSPPKSEGTRTETSFSSSIGIQLVLEGFSLPLPHFISTYLSYMTACPVKVKLWHQMWKRQPYRDCLACSHDFIIVCVHFPVTNLCIFIYSEKWKHFPPSSLGSYG